MDANVTSATVVVVVVADSAVVVVREVWVKVPERTVVVLVTVPVDVIVDVAIFPGFVTVTVALG